VAVSATGKFRFSVVVSATGFGGGFRHRLFIFFAP
jgi:hypothetical protein